AESERQGDVQSTTSWSDEGVDEGPRVFAGKALEAQDFTLICGDDVEIAVRAEEHAGGMAQPAAAQRNEGVEEGARLPVVAQDPARAIAICYIKVAVASEDHAARVGQLAGIRKNAEECAGCAVVAQHVVGLVIVGKQAITEVEVVVRSQVHV